MQQERNTGDRVRFGVFEVDLRARELRKHGMRIRLQGQPFAVLAMLLESPGTVVTRDELQTRLWSTDTFVNFDHGLNKAINKLREALGDSAENPRFVETVARKGYRFLADVREIDEAPVSTVGLESQHGLPDSPQPGDSGPSAKGRPANRLFWLLAGILLLAIAAALLPAIRKARTRAAGIQSLAVLPFESISND